MTIVDVSKGTTQIVGIGDIKSLQDYYTKEILKFELQNHDAVHEGAFPVYTAKSKEGREYTVELKGEVRVTAGPRPDPYAKQKEKSEDRNPFKEGKQTPDTFAKKDKELEAEEEEDPYSKFKGVFSDKKKK